MSDMKVVTGFTFTPPVIGRITMGHSEVRGTGESAKARPVRDDEFHITTLVQNKADRSWEPHPITKTIKKEPKTKLREIPVVIA